MPEEVKIIDVGKLGKGGSGDARKFLLEDEKKLQAIVALFGIVGVAIFAARMFGWL